MNQVTIKRYVLLAAALLVLLNIPRPLSTRVKCAVRDVLQPLQSGVVDLSRKFREGVRTARGLRGLALENRDLAAEVTRLRNEVRAARSMETENERLREQLLFAQRSDRYLIPAEVIARDTGGWWETVRLDRGREGGVDRDMAVVTADGLLGRTTEASARTSEVKLITDPDSKVSVRRVRTGAFGLLNGAGASERGQGVCRLEFVNKNLPAMPGDEVVTSGLGGVFPKGLLVGYVDRVHTNQAGLFQRAEVIVKADLSMLDFVFVIADRPGEGNPAENPRLF